MPQYWADGYASSISWYDQAGHVVALRVRPIVRPDEPERDISWVSYPNTIKAAISIAATRVFDTDGSMIRLFGAAPQHCVRCGREAYASENRGDDVWEPVCGSLRCLRPTPS